VNGAEVTGDTTIGVTDIKLVTTFDTLIYDSSKNITINTTSLSMANATTYGINYATSTMVNRETNVNTIVNIYVGFNYTILMNPLQDFYYSGLINF
jgi:hypothetical protein